MYAASAVLPVLPGAGWFLGPIYGHEMFRELILDIRVE